MSNTKANIIKTQQQGDAVRTRAVAFGRNYWYQINQSDDNDDMPWKHDGDGLPVSAVCTAQSTVILSKAGKIYQVGAFHGRVFPHFTRVEIPLPVQCLQVSAGRHFCVARMEGGVVMTWGAGHFGQLGCDDSTATTFAPQPLLVERLLPAQTGSPVCAVAAGDWHALALTESGITWAWGSNRSYQCGQKQLKQQQPGTIPLPLPILSSLPLIRQIAAGRSHSCALSTSGQVYCWGNSAHGQCGTGVMTRRGVPGLLPAAPVEGLPKTLEMVQIAAAGHHCISLSKAGRVFSWGDGREGQLGLSISNSASTGSSCSVAFQQQASKPRLIADLDFVAVAAGQEWKLQQQNASSSSSAAEVLANIPKIVSIYAAPSYSAAISSSGHVYCWGSNDVGQLGLETPSFLHQSSMDQTDDSEQQVQQGIEREIHVRTFDSNHNVLLPVRVRAVDDLRVDSLAVGPNHLWCFGRERENDENAVVGRTLYEVQEEQRLKRLSRGAAIRINTLTAIRAKQQQQQQQDDDDDDDEHALIIAPEDIGIAETGESAVDEPSNDRGPIVSQQVSPSGTVRSDKGTPCDNSSEEKIDAEDALQNMDRMATNSSTNDASAAIIETITGTPATAPNNNAIVEDLSGRTSSSSSSSSGLQEFPAATSELSAVALGEQQRQPQEESGFVAEAVNGVPPKLKKRRGLIKRISKGLRRRWSSDKKGEMSTMGTDENATNYSGNDDKVAGS